MEPFVRFQRCCQGGVELCCRLGLVLFHKFFLMENDSGPKKFLGCHEMSKHTSLRVSLGGSGVLIGVSSCIL